MNMIPAEKARAIIVQRPNEEQPKANLRCLYVTNQMRFPLSNGGELRRWHIMQGLLQAGEVDALVFDKPGVGACLDTFRGCRRVTTVSSEHLGFSALQQRRYKSTIGRGALALLNPRPFEFLGELTPMLRNQLKEELPSYDLVWFHTARTAIAVGPISGVPTVLDADDFAYVREGLLLRATPWYGAKLWNYVDVAKLWWWERQWPRWYDVVVRCSAEDRQRHPAPNIEVIPNGAQIPAHYERAPEARLLFVGSMDFPPNGDGMKWFLSNIWPRVLKEVPHALCDIVGKTPSTPLESTHRQNGVQIHGFVNCLASFYHRAAASIAPLRAGSGTRLKIIESLAHAVPVVSTTIGAFGLDAGAEEGLTRCDCEATFAEACIARLKAPHAWQEAAQRGRDYVSYHYNWESIQTQVKNLACRVAQVSSIPKHQNIR